MTNDPVARYLSERGAKYDSRNRMRLMKSSEMLDTALRIYQRLGLTFLRVTAIPALLCLASIGFVNEYVFPNLFTTSSNGDPIRILGETAGSLAMALFIGGPLFLLGLSYSSAIVVQLVSDYMVGIPPNVDRATTLARKSLTRLFLVNLKELLLSVSCIVASTAFMGLGGYLSKTTDSTDMSAGVIALVGIFGLVVGFVIFLYIIACDALVAPIVVLEAQSTRRVSKRSRLLLKRSAYHTSGTDTIWILYFLLLFLATILAVGLYFFVSILNLHDCLATILSSVPGAPIILEAFDLIPSFAVVWTLLPVWASVITIVYYDRRIRLEGFDIDVLASEA